MRRTGQDAVRPAPSSSRSRSAHTLSVGRPASTPPHPEHTLGTPRTASTTGATQHDGCNQLRPVQPGATGATRGGQCGRHDWCGGNDRFGGTSRRHEHHPLRKQQQQHPDVTQQQPGNTQKHSASTQYRSATPSNTQRHPATSSNTQHRSAGPGPGSGRLAPPCRSPRTGSGAAKKRAGWRQVVPGRPTATPRVASVGVHNRTARARRPGSARPGIIAERGHIKTLCVRFPAPPRSVMAGC